MLDRHRFQIAHLTDQDDVRFLCAGIFRVDHVGDAVLAAGSDAPVHGDEPGVLPQQVASDQAGDLAHGIHRQTDRTYAALGHDDAGGGRGNQRRSEQKAAQIDERDHLAPEVEHAVHPGRRSRHRAECAHVLAVVDEAQLGEPGAGPRACIQRFLGQVLGRLSGGGG